MPGKKAILSMDTWAVVLSLGLALCVKLGLIRVVSW